MPAGRFTVRRACILFAALACGLALAAPRDTRADSVDGERVPRVWYRSSAGCPDGNAFIARLASLGREASLAAVGDRVDFVVSVAHAAENSATDAPRSRPSSGRLERQSREQTVAIRDVRAASCAEVVDALALSLDLALEPDREPSAPPAGQQAPDGVALRLGLQGTLETGLAHAAFPGAALFVDVSSPSAGWSARASLRGAYAEPDARIPLDVRLLATRAEACWSSALGSVRLGPCAGVDVGIVIADSGDSGGRRDVGMWGGAVAHARAAWQLGNRAALELQLGGLLPFVRYEFGAPTGEVAADSAALGVEGGVGFSFLL